MRYIAVKELTDMEDRIRFNLQLKYFEMQEYKNDKDITTEWNAIMLFANCITDKGKRWGVRAGEVVLLKEVE